MPCGFMAWTLPLFSCQCKRLQCRYLVTLQRQHKQSMEARDFFFAEKNKNMRLLTCITNVNDRLKMDEITDNWRFNQSEQTEKVGEM